jgi:signal transduction histidine kinase
MTVGSAFGQVAAEPAAEAAPGEPAGGSRSGQAGAAGPPPRSRWALRNWRVRSRLLLLITIPVLTALVLGGFRIASSVRSALAYQRALQLATLTSDATVLAQRLEDERDQTVYFIALPSGGRASANGPAVTAAQRSAKATGLEQLAVVKSQWAQTDKALRVVLSGLSQVSGSFPAQVRQQAATVRSELTTVLPQLRSAATTTRLPALVVVQKYASLIDDLLALETATVQGASDPQLAQSVQVLGLVSQMQEEASEQRAILTAALLQHDLTPAELSALTSAQADQQANLAAFQRSATPAELQLWARSSSSQAAYLAPAYEQQAISLAAQAPASSAANLAADPTTADDWYGAMSHTISYQLGSVQRRLVSEITARAAALRNGAVTFAVVVGAVVLALLALALLFTAVVARSLVRPLRRLRAGALEVAGVRLPETVRQMSEGGAAEPGEVEPIDVDSADEIGEVARAFDQVHREAVRLAANEAALRGNINSMFVNLSRRSQSLVERQIRLIDGLEQGEQDPERLANLFQMDHLATRMRRNSENLLVLAGHEVSRRWTQSVALVDVLRAAVSEIEQYERVTLNVQPGLSVRGQAVNDVVHLLSELVENATSFSAADTPVSVSAHLLNSGGVLIDITDQGVGMGSEEMAHANWRLDNPPVVDVAVSRRMGLFVVARLAARHGIRVRLRSAAMGGLTALVWLPDEVISQETAAPATLSPRQAEAAIPGRLADWPLATGEGQSAVAAAVSAARTPRFTPLRPDLPDTVAFSGAGAEAAQAAGPGPVLPGEEAPAGGAGSAAGSGEEPPKPGWADRDIAEPAATAEGPEVTAGSPVPGEAGPDGEQSMLSVLGSPVGGPGTGPGSAAPGPGQLLTAALGNEGPLPRREVIVPPASPGEENRLPIFESVESDWFRRGRHGAARPPVAAGVPATGWTSPADEGWRAAEVAHTPITSGVTGAGLPKRIPQANLVPGGIATGTSAVPPSGRSAAEARDRMASFQRGVQQARASRGEPPSGDGDDGAG